MPFTEQSKHNWMEKCQHCNKDFFTILVRDYWENQSYNALQHQEQFENAAQEHQRVAYEQVEIAAILATNRTAAHMTSRFRDIENNVEASFSHQQRGLLSEITSEPAQAFEVQRNTLVHEATADDAVRDSHSGGSPSVKN